MYAQNAGSIYARGIIMTKPFMSLLATFISFSFYLPIHKRVLHTHTHTHTHTIIIIIITKLTLRVVNTVSSTSRETIGLCPVIV